MSVSSVNSTDWASLISQYASQRTTKIDTTTSSSQDSSSNLAGVTAVNSDGDTLQLSEAALSAAEMFSKIDTDGGGSLSESEFVAARPEDVTEEMASTLYSSPDSGSSVAVTVTVKEYEAVLANAPPPSATSTSSTTETYEEIDTNQDGIVSATELASAIGSTSSSSDTSTSSISDESETFDPLDTNQNGVVSAAELAFASPDDVTEEMFNSLDTDGSVGLTQTEYAALSNTSGTNT